MKPIPLSGLDMLTTIWMKSFNVDKEDGVKLAYLLIDEIKENAERGMSQQPRRCPKDNM